MEITRRDDGPVHDFDSALENGGGRSFGAAPSEVHRANTLTSSTSLCDRPHHLMPPHRGSQVPGAGGSSSALAIWP
jgi:hypothetical protein